MEQNKRVKTLKKKDEIFEIKWIKRRMISGKEEKHEKELDKSMRGWE